VLDALLAEARLRWGLDPLGGLQVATVEGIVGMPIEPSRPLLIVPRAALMGPADSSRASLSGDFPGGAPDAPPGSAARALPASLPGRAGPGGDDPLRLLGRLYPAEHPVGRFRAATGTTVGALIAEDLAGPLYIGSIAPELAVAGPWAMPWISARLRRPDGCPWDREQTHASLRKHLLEEAYEVYDALDAGATPELAGELGDLWLQIVLHAQLAAEAGVFDLTDVQAAIAAKIVRRHPHVFGDAVARTASDVNRQWERIKADERAAAADAEQNEVGARAGPRSALDGISPSMPALAASQEMQERAANLGYDWPSIDGVIDKVVEETDELRRAADDVEWSEEFGDLLFVLVNVARWRGIEAEAAVRAANAKFRRRFASVERLAAAQGVALRDLEFDALDALWDAAKAEEKTT
jgi:MazG family protein